MSGVLLKEPFELVHIACVIAAYCYGHKEKTAECVSAAEEKML
ncbi:transporter [Bacillus sp. FMQ74]|nr:transporter [Bacillus sp. FMQ74]